MDRRNRKGSTFFIHFLPAKTQPTVLYGVGLYCGQGIGHYGLLGELVCVCVCVFVQFRMTD